VGGILSQKTARPLKVLHGGLEAYWAESELKSAVKETPLSGAGPAKVKPQPPASAPPPPPPAPAPAPPKKKSAGC